MFRLSDRIATINKPRLMVRPKPSELAVEAPTSKGEPVDVFPVEENQMPVVAEPSDLPSPSDLPLPQGAPQAITTVEEASSGLVGPQNGLLATLVGAPLLLFVGVGRRKKIEEAEAEAAEATAEAERLAISAQRLKDLAVESKSKALKAMANADKAKAKAAAAKTWRISGKATAEVEDAARAAAKAQKAA